MKNIKELLQEADPLRNEPEISPERRDVQRRALLAAASSVRHRDKFESRSSAAMLAMLAAIVVVILLFGGRMGSPVIPDVHAAVRFEVKLAEDHPAPGLHAVKLSASRSIYLHDEAVVTNGDISSARAIRLGSQYEILVEFKPAGAAKMRAATASHIGKPVAILLDGKVVAAPVLRLPIGTSAEIDGNFTQADAERIVKGIVGK